MSIKDKITPQLKVRFLEEINKTIKTGNEHGFLLCKDNNGHLSTSKTSIGENDHINFSEIKTQCPFMIQGDFHTHASVADVKRFIRSNIPEEIVSDDLARDITLKLYKKNNISIIEPSHGDLLGALVLKKNITNRKIPFSGTVCVGSDAEPGKIACWTARDNINDTHYNRASIELKDSRLIRNSPREWIKPLFNKEIIEI